MGMGRYWFLDAGPCIRACLWGELNAMGRDGGCRVGDSGERGDLGWKGRFRQAAIALKLEGSNSDFIRRHWRSTGCFLIKG